MRQDHGPRVWCDGCGTWASARGALAVLPFHLVDGRRCGTWCRPPMPATVLDAMQARRQTARARPNRAARQAVRKVARAVQEATRAAALLDAQLKLTAAHAAAFNAALPREVVVDGPAPAPGEVRL